MLPRLTPYDGETFLEELALQNFRQFADLRIQFHRKLTVLVAPNGGGKTAVLDATAVALRYFVDKLQRKPSFHGFELTDGRLARTPDAAMVPQWPVSFTARGRMVGEDLSWERELGSGLRTTYAKASGLARRADALLDTLQRYSNGHVNLPPDLPLIAYYGTGRLWAEGRISEKKKQAALNLTQPTAAYQDCLSPSSSYNPFVLWYERVVREAQNEQASGAPRSPHRPQEVLAAVRAATDEVLKPTGWRRIDWDFVEGTLIAEHPVHGRLPVSRLSDGIRNMIAMVGDLAHRAVRLNRHHGAGAVSLTPGIVLVDEVDMHLHPEWQQSILDSLQQAFPRVQWVVTTHSPQVISTAQMECVRILRDDGSVTTPTLQTRGVESAALLAEVMGIDPIPPVPEASDVAEYKVLVERGSVGDVTAKSLKERIVRHFGEMHPVVLECERIERWQAFKERRASAQERS